MTLLFRDAHEAFSNGDFYKARELYNAAGKVFGEDTVKYNLYLCDKKLKEISEGKTKVGDKFLSDLVCHLRQLVLF